MSLLYTLMVGDGGRVTRPLKLLGTVARHPLRRLRTLSPVGWSRHTIIVLCMQTLDNAISLVPKRALGGGIRLRTHILGGAVIGADPSRGVVDARQRVFGYENLLVCDGSAIPANVGVNPSLTIAALAEHAIAHVPAAGAQPAEVTSRANISNTSR
jgi:cholesterol oxidase